MPNSNFSDSDEEPLTRPSSSANPSVLPPTNPMNVQPELQQHSDDLQVVAVKSVKKTKRAPRQPKQPKASSTNTETNDSSVAPTSSLKRKFDELVKIGDTSSKLIRSIKESGVSSTDELVVKLLDQCSKARESEMKTVVDGFLITLREEYGYNHTLNNDIPECGVCYDPLTSKPTSLLHHCGHVFCTPCVDKLRPNVKCPKCRMYTGTIIKCHLGA